MKKVFGILLALILTVSVIFSCFTVRPVYAGNSIGIVKINGKTMFKDQFGNLYPIWKDTNGKLFVRLGGNTPGALIPLTEMYGLLETRHKNVSIKSGSFPAVVYVFDPVSYSQEYYKWGSDRLGNSTGGWTIRSGGCFLTSTAMVLATYNLRISGEIVNPKNLNVWMRNHNGFGGDTGDDLIFSALNNFPGINYTYDIAGDSNAYSNAYLAIYYGSMPVICFKKGPVSYHFCAFIQTDGVASHTTVNKIINPANSNIYDESGLTQTVKKSRLYLEEHIPDPEFFVAVRN